MHHGLPVASDLMKFTGKRVFGMVLADPPWRFIFRCLH